MGLSERERRVCEEIAGRRDALLADLRLHVGLATGGNNGDALERSREVLGARLGALGAKREDVEGEVRPGWLWGGEGEAGGDVPATAVFRREVGGAGGGLRPILLAGHLDTVHDPRGSFRELTVSADGKRAVGPGCADMKGGLVIAMAALEALQAAGEELAWTVLLNSDEETGSFCSRRAIEAEAARVAGLGGVGIVLEPAMPDGGLVVERSGSGQFMIEVRGKSAHVGRDFGAGISAVNAPAEILGRVARVANVGKGRIVSVGPIEGGKTTNSVPERARAWGNMRFGDDATAVGIERALREAVTEPTIPGATARLEIVVARPAKPLTPEVQGLADAARTAAADLGQALPFGKTGGVCDGNLMQAAGLPTLDTLGVRGGGLHTTDEWIDLASVVERCQLLAVVMMRAASGAEIKA